MNSSFATKTDKARQLVRLNAELPAGAIHFDSLPDAALVDIETFARITGSGVSTMWRRLKADPAFPRPTRIGSRCTRFEVGAIRRWLAAKAGA